MNSFKAQSHASHASQQHDPVRAALELVSLTVDGGGGGGGGHGGRGGHEGHEDDLSPPPRLTSTGGNRNKRNSSSKSQRGSSDVEQFRALDALVFQAAVANMVQVRTFNTSWLLEYQLVGVNRLCSLWLCGGGEQSTYAFRTQG
jgi:hypothetical protein